MSSYKLYKQERKLKEMPGMEKPVRHFYLTDTPKQQNEFEADLKRYNDHVADLKEYDINPDDWKDWDEEKLLSESDFVLQHQWWASYKTQPSYWMDCSKSTYDLMNGYTGERIRIIARPPKPVTVKKAIDVLTKAIKDDPGYYYGWQSNIAMAFYDEYNEMIKEQPEENWVHMVSNNAAKRFLNGLANISEPASPVAERDERLVWVKAADNNFPTVKGNKFLRHPYKDGRWHGWWSYIVPEAIDKDYWIKMGYEWLYEGCNDSLPPLPETPSHEGKDADYWKQLALAAGELLSCVPIDASMGRINLYLAGFDEALKKYQSLKQQK